MLATIALPVRPRQETLAVSLAAPDRPSGHPLDGAFEGHAGPEQVRDGPEHPHRHVEQTGREYDGRAAEKFDDCARLAALGGGEPGQAAQILRLFGDPEPFDRGAGARFALHAPEVARRANEIFHALEPRGSQETGAEPSSLHARLDDGKP